MPNFYGTQELIVTSDAGDSMVSKPALGDKFEEEIIEACSCIRDGKLESNIMLMGESIRLLELMDTVLEQINLSYSSDK